MTTVSCVIVCYFGFITFLTMKHIFAVGDCIKNDLKFTFY